jgi:hypothetical protein
MTKDVETFRRRANALRLQAALATAGIQSRVRSQGDVWVVFTRPDQADAAFNISIGTIYI